MAARSRWLPGTGRRRWFTAAALTGVACLASFLCLLSLPGRSSEHVRFNLADIDRPPQAGGFSVGPIFWDMRAYEADPKLEPLRAFFRSQCGGQRGLDAARCLANAFQSLFPWGSPRHEFVDAQYDPVADFDAHRHGEAGHCVTRSGLIATILLAQSIPARQVQISLTARIGHNILQVWDADAGWVVVDPSYDRISVDGEAHPASLREVVLGSAMWQSFGTPSDDRGFYEMLADLAGRGDPPEITFPEPWLYTRTGQRTATWPFRGMFAHGGGIHFLLGPAQTSLRLAAVFCSLASVLCALLGMADQRRLSTRMAALDSKGETPAALRQADG
jgi:hypothetical protein